MAELYSTSDEAWDPPAYSHTSRFLNFCDLYSAPQPYHDKLLWLEENYENSLQLQQHNAGSALNEHFQPAEALPDTVSSPDINFDQYVNVGFKLPSAISPAGDNKYNLLHFSVGVIEDAIMDCQASNNSPLFGALLNRRSHISIQHPTHSSENPANDKPYSQTCPFNLLEMDAESHHGQSLEYNWNPSTLDSSSRKHEPLSAVGVREVSVPEQKGSPYVKTLAAQSPFLSDGVPLLSVQSLNYPTLTHPVASDQISPCQKNTFTSKRSAAFDDCMNVFETTPGAMKKVKRRRKLAPSSQESFKVTRKIGACLECRFRKRMVILDSFQ